MAPGVVRFGGHAVEAEKPCPGGWSWGDLGIARHDSDGLRRFILMYEVDAMRYRNWAACIQRFGQRRTFVVPWLECAAANWPSRHPHPLHDSCTSRRSCALNVTPRICLGYKYAIPCVACVRHQVSTAHLVARCRTSLVLTLQLAPRPREASRSIHDTFHDTLQCGIPYITPLFMPWRRSCAVALSWSGTH